MVTRFDIKYHNDLRNRLAHEYDCSNFSEYFKQINDFSKLLGELDKKFEEIGNTYTNEFAKDFIA